MSRRHTPQTGPVTTLSTRGPGAQSTPICHLSQRSLMNSIDSFGRPRSHAHKPASGTRFGALGHFSGPRAPSRRATRNPSSKLQRGREHAAVFTTASSIGPQIRCASQRNHHHRGRPRLEPVSLALAVACQGAPRSCRPPQSPETVGQPCGLSRAMAAAPGPCPCPRRTAPRDERAPRAVPACHLATRQLRPAFGPGPLMLRRRWTAQRSAASRSR